MGSAPSSSGASPSLPCGTLEWASVALRSASRRRQASSSRPFATRAVSGAGVSKEEEYIHTVARKRELSPLEGDWIGGRHLGSRLRGLVLEV